MKHREKAPDMTTDGWSDDSERLANWDQKAEQQRARELQDLDRKAEAAAEKVEMQRYLAVDIEPPTLQEIRNGNEIGLLGSALATDSALPALRAVQGQFYDPFHENVAAAILDQAADGAAHDYEAINAVLRERKVYERIEIPTEVDTRPYGPYYPNLPPGQEQPNRQWAPDPPEVRSQLPWEMDPLNSRRSVNAAEYGLGEWQANAMPYSANHFAREIRQDYRARYLEDVGTRLQQRARGAAEAGEDAGFALIDAANEMVNVPPRLDWDLQPLRETQSFEAVDTRQPRPITLPSEAVTVTRAPDLGLPKRPTLSLAGQQALASA